MGYSNVEIPIFADTNLGTRLVVVVSHYSTANDFKRELEKAHLNCFPQLGRIKVEVVMVKRNSCFYHLPETLLLKHLFQHLSGIRSLHVEACQYNMLYQLGSSEYVDDQILDHYDVKSIFNPTKLKTSATDSNIEKLRCRRKRKKMKRFTCFKTTLSVVSRIVHFSKTKKKKRKNIKKSYKFNGVKGHDEPRVVFNASFALPTNECEGKGEKQQNSSPPAKSHSKDLSEAISVSGIIRKYFSNHDEVNSSSMFYLEEAQTPQWKRTRMRTYICDLEKENDLLSAFQPQTSLQIDVPFPNGSVRSLSRASRNTSKRVEIGNRLISASKSVGVMTSKNKLFTPGRLVPESTSFNRSLVFEMSDDD